MNWCFVITIICRELGIGMVPYSPLGRGFFSGKASQQALDSKDTRNVKLPTHLTFKIYDSIRISLKHFMDCSREVQISVGTIQFICSINKFVPGLAIVYSCSSMWSVASVQGLRFIVMIDVHFSVTLEWILILSYDPYGWIAGAVPQVCCREFAKEQDSFPACVNPCWKTRVLPWSACLGVGMQPRRWSSWGCTDSW